MRTETVPQLEQVLQSYRRECKILSFDVFDTLLYRRITSPDRIRICSANYFSKLASGRGIHITADQADALRAEVEGDLRKQAAISGSDPECGFVEIVKEWVERGLGDLRRRNDVSRLVDCELSAEKDVVYAPQGMFQILENCRSAFDRIICISDMYYSENMIRSLLYHAGYEGLIDAVYVSSETGKLKRTGNLYNHVLKECSVSANELLHVGDNVLSDYSRAKKIGVRAVLHRDKDYHYRSSRAEVMKTAGKRWFSSDEALLNAHQGYYESRWDRKKGTIYDVGYWLVAPLLVSFISHTIRQLINSQVDTVIFPAREGFVLKQIYDEVNEKMFSGKGPRSRYLYLSRRSLFLGSIRNFDDVVLKRFPVFYGKKGLIDLLNYFELPEHARLEVLANVYPKLLGMKGDRKWSYRELRSVLEHPVFSLFANQSILQHWSNAIGYLEQELDLERHQSFAFVDVGWNGTIQDALFRVLTKRYPNSRIKGYYLALLGQMPVMANNSNSYYGTYFDYRKGDEAPSFNRFVQLFEFSSSAPHATTLGYEYLDGKFCPVFRGDDTEERKLEIKDSHHRSSYQAGILDYLQDFKQLSKYFTEEELCEHPTYLLDVLDRLLRFPDSDTANELLHFTQIEDFGTDTTFNQNKRLNKDRSKQPIESEVAYYLWKEAYFRRWPAGNVLYNIYRALQWKVY